MPTSNSNSNPTVDFDPYAYLNIVRNPDGSITRDPTRYPNTPLTPDQNPSLIIKDLHIDQSEHTWARAFLPRVTPDHPSAKLPLIVYFHGGGFVYGGAASSIYHDFCADMAVKVVAAVVSVDHRLSPEHRLPAAYEDAVDALNRIARSENLEKSIDLSNCHVMGSSSGANIAYHAGLRASTLDLKPLRIRGLILHHPFFGGTRRTGSELRPEFGSIVRVHDLMWDLALPVGAGRDHGYCDPTAGGGSGMLEGIGIGRLGWRVMLSGCEGDPLVDRMVEAVDVMDENGVEVVAHFSLGGSHLVELTDRCRAVALFLAVRDFISLQLEEV